MCVTPHHLVYENDTTKHLVLHTPAKYATQVSLNDTIKLLLAPHASVQNATQVSMNDAIKLRPVSHAFVDYATRVSVNDTIKLSQISHDSAKNVTRVSLQDTTLPARLIPPRSGGRESHTFAPPRHPWPPQPPACSSLLAARVDQRGRGKNATY